MPVGTLTFTDVVLSVPRPHVLLVTINRPEARNAVNRQMNDHLEAVWDYFEDESDLWVAVLTGAAPTFCAGLDLVEISKTRGIGDGRKMLFGGFAGLTFRETLKKPIIAAVNGAAFGGGFELVMACDIIIASEAAEFGMLEVKRGLAPMSGGAANMPKLVGYHNAMLLMLTGRTFNARRALEMGFVQEVVSPEKLLDHSLDLASEIASNSPDSVRATKAQARNGREVGWSRGSRQAVLLPETVAMLIGPNLREGAKAFAQKRAPNWKPPLEVLSWTVWAASWALWGLSLLPVG